MRALGEGRAQRRRYGCCSVPLPRGRCAELAALRCAASRLCRSRQRGPAECVVVRAVWRSLSTADRQCTATNRGTVTAHSRPHRGRRPEPSRAEHSDSTQHSEHRLHTGQSSDTHNRASTTHGTLCLRHCGQTARAQPRPLRCAGPASLSSCRIPPPLHPRSPSALQFPRPHRTHLRYQRDRSLDRMKSSRSMKMA